MFSKDIINHVSELKLSNRNEYELSDLYNSAFYSRIVPVFDTWCDITYSDDKDKMLSIIRNSSNI